MTRNEIKEILKGMNWTELQLADALMVGEVTVKRWISGDTYPRPATLRRLYQLLEDARARDRKKVAR